MKSMKFLLIAVVLIIGTHTSADEIWQGYPNGNSVIDTAFQGDYVWCATEGSLVQWDKRDGTYRQYTMQDGLLSNRIKAVFVDKDNLLWIASLGGIQTYDGVTFTEYSLENSGLENKYTTAIDQAPDGAMWFGISGGLARLDGDSWTFYTNDNSELDVDYVNTFAIDLDGVVWFSHIANNTVNGLMRFDGETMTLYSPVNSDLVSKYVMDIAVDTNNVKWIATPSGLQSFDGSTWTKHERPGTKYIDSITSIDIDSDNNIWIATMPGLVSGADYYPDEESNIIQYDGDSWIVLPVAEIVTKPYRGFAYISVDDDVPWFVTYNRCAADSRTLYSYNGGELSAYLVDGPLSYLFNNIYVDDNNDKWFATGYGIARFNGYSWERFQFDLAPDEYCYETYNGEVYYNPTYLSSTNEILSIVRDKDGVIWITSRFGVRSYDGTTWTLYSEVNVEEIQNTSSAFYYAGVTDNNIKYFLGARYLVTYDGENWTSDSWLNDNNLEVPVWIGGNSPYMMDDDDILWFIDFQGRVVSYDGAEWTVLTPESTGIEGIGLSCVTDNNNVKWFGTNKGLYSFDGFEWKNHSADITGIKGITNMVVDDKNVLWIINGSKLQSYDGVSQVEYAGELAGFSIQLAIDKDGLIWIGGLENIGPGGIVTVDKNAVYTSVDKEQVLPTAVPITANYPNPFNPSTTIEFSLPEKGSVNLIIYNTMGQKIRELVSEKMSPGLHSIVWDGCDDSGTPVSSGVFISRLRMGDSVVSHRMMLVK